MSGVNVNNGMKVLLVGSGGREHALAWALAKSSRCEKLYCAPGNAGIAQEAECVPIAADDAEGLKTFAMQNAIDLVVVGPEGPLVAGLADSIRACGVKVFGPSRAAAQLEGSKGFMKDLCARYNIPTASYRRFSKPESARAYAAQQKPPIVIKADGLAAGKGVVICQTHQEAYEVIDNMLTGGEFGQAGREIVIEQFMDGEELSYFALADGKTILPLGSAQDHKRAFDGDEGPNTGGMGACSPAHLMTASLEEKIIHRIIQPTIRGMIAEGIPFTGVLFAGLMIVRDEPYLIEYNVRFGDPECQALMMRLEGDLLEILLAGAEGRLDDLKGKVTWSPRTAVCVIMATKGYPGDYPKRTPIARLEKAAEIEETRIFHAGTVRDEAGGFLSNGGRVLGITAMGDSAAEARQRAYAAVDRIDWPEGFCRRDIGARALKTV